MKEQLDRLDAELRLRGYRPGTRRAYTSALREYFLWKKADFECLEEESIRAFLLQKERGGSRASTRNLFLNAIKFYYREVVHAPQVIGIRSAREDCALPVVLSRREVGRMLQVVENTKHRLLLALSYGAGLRVSEAVNLRVQDADVGELVLHVKGGKGGKDRVTVIPEALAPALRCFLAGRSGAAFLFESERGGGMTPRTAQKIFAVALRRAGILKSATFHSLRHSFATHLLEDGVDMRYVQELLGHRNIRTTQRYTRVTNPQVRNIKSPLTAVRL